ncbi:MAG: hypothetical protein ACOC5J_00395 [Gemmatimonadota bacterium]
MLGSLLSMNDSLAGADYRVVGFRFGMMGDFCWSLGVRPETDVRVRSRTDRGVAVELEDGRRLLLDPLYVRFIDLVPVETAPFHEPGGSLPCDIARES